VGRPIGRAPLPTQIPARKKEGRKKRKYSKAQRDGKRGAKNEGRPGQQRARESFREGKVNQRSNNLLRDSNLVFFLIKAWGEKIERKQANQYVLRKKGDNDSERKYSSSGVACNQIFETGGSIGRGDKLKKTKELVENRVRKLRTVPHSGVNFKGKDKIVIAGKDRQGDRHKPYVYESTFFAKKKMSMRGGQDGGDQARNSTG